MNRLKIVPLSIPNLEGDKKNVNEALDAGWVSTGGAFIIKNKDNMLDYLNTNSQLVKQILKELK